MNCRGRLQNVIMTVASETWLETFSYNQYPIQQSGRGGLMVDPIEVRVSGAPIFISVGYLGNLFVEPRKLNCDLLLSTLSAFLTPNIVSTVAFGLNFECSLS